MKSVSTIFRARGVNVEEEKAPSTLATTIGIWLVAIIPPFVLLSAFGNVWKHLALGAAAWAVAVVLKFPAASLLNIFIGKHSRPAVIAALYGIMSAVAELGAAAACFSLLSPGLSLTDVIAFGVGASCIEISLVLSGGVRPGPEVRSAWISGARRSACVRHMMFIERLTTLLGHVASRGLVYLSLTLPDLSLALIAVATFGAVDGVLIYGRLASWDWFDPRVCRSFYGFITLVSLFEVGIFALAATLK